MEHCDGKGSHCDGAVNQVKVVTCYERIYHCDRTVKCWDKLVKHNNRLRKWIFVI